MEFWIISIAAFLASVLTFFSGFGLGTLLLPVFAIFFPVDTAIALTGVVHFANNLFKIILVGRHVDRPVLLRFGIPAIAASFAGAWALLGLSDLPVSYRYEMWGKLLEVTPVKLVVAVLLLVFGLLEFSPRFRSVQFERKRLVWGGILSGFFGGLTGMQGAIRSAFLIKSGLGKEAYIATGVMIACFIDFTRLSVYASRFRETNLEENITLVIAAVLAAIGGALVGNRLLKKVTLKLVQGVVAVMLVLIALGMGMGVI
jgi:uncharacterized membrane protein YfcA